MRGELAGLRGGERSALPRSEDQDPHPGLHQPRHPGGRAAHVEDRERHLQRQILRQGRPQSAREEHSLSAHREALRLRLDRDDLVEDQGPQRQGDERRDPIAGLQLGGRGMPRPDARDASDEHPTRPRNRIVHLAPVAHDRRDEAREHSRLLLRLLPKLPEARGVDVEVLHVDEQLVVAEGHRRIEDLRLLRQDALGLHHAAQPVRVRHPCLRTDRARERGRGAPDPGSASTAMVPRGRADGPPPVGVPARGRAATDRWAAGRW